MGTIKLHPVHGVCRGFRGFGFGEGFGGQALGPCSLEAADMSGSEVL